MKETYRAYNSRDELDRVFELGNGSKVVFQVTFSCLLSTRVFHTDREAGSLFVLQ